MQFWQFYMQMMSLATGAGKSLCMFLPPLVTSDTSVAIIVSPLIGLMEDQVLLVVMYLYKYTKVSAPCTHFNGEHSNSVYTDIEAR